MGIQNQGLSGDIVEAGLRNYNAGASLHTVTKPIAYGSLGHYRVAARVSMATSQNANSRLFEVRNPSATALIIPTRLRVSILPAGTVTAAYRMELDLFKLTTFTAVDTTGTVTPGANPSAKRTSTMTAAPQAAIRWVTAAGAAGGMTGGTLTKDANPAAIHQGWVATAAATTVPLVAEMLDDVNGTHPFVFAQNEGFEIENIVAGSGTANVIDVMVDFSWAEATTF